MHNRGYKQLTGCSVLVEVMKKKVFIDLLLAMKRGCKTSDGGKFIGFIECTFTFFEIFKPDTFHIHRMPLDLTGSVMGMAMKCRDNSLQMQGNCFCTQRASQQGLDESTEDVVTKSDVSAILIK
jgi:hypothetical protein